MIDLITRVRQAKGGDQWINAELHVLANPQTCEAAQGAEAGLYWQGAGGAQTLRRAPPYTSSIDAAISLVERVRPAFWWVVGGSEGMEYEAEVGRWKAKGHSAPLALLAALLSSIEDADA